MTKINEAEKQIEISVKSEDCFVSPNQVEDEAKIVKIDCLVAPTLRLILFYSLIVVTGGAFLLLCRWFDSLIIFLKFTKSNPKAATSLLIYGFDGTKENVDIEKRVFCFESTRQTYRSFVYRLYTFYFDETDQKFKPVQFAIKNKTYEQIHEEMGSGIQSDQTYEDRLLTYGKNSTHVKPKGNIEVIVDEVLSPFYIFQIFAILFWYFWNDYKIYAGVILGISVITLCFTFYSVKMNQKKLKQRSFYETEVKVYRKSSKYQSSQEGLIIKSTFLAPGDLIEVPDGRKLPCDVILLNGTCVMNESMLTGESIPVIKQQLPKISKEFDPLDADQFLLYSGTECLEAKASSKGVPVVGVVLRTGFDTMKGRLVRSFIYTKPENFKFYRDSIKYVMAMGVVAILSFCICIQTYLDQELGASGIFNKALDILTCAVPPALPTCLAVGTAVSSARLEKQQILTKSEMKINIAGRVQIMCFDKTGTLTKDSLDLYGVRAVLKTSRAKCKFEHFVSDNVHDYFNNGEEKQLSHKMLELMATCHALTYVKGVLSGDPLDLRMFESTGWQLNEENTAENSGAFICLVKPPTTVVDPNAYYDPYAEVHVIKRFDFVAKLQRMSTIVQDPKEKNQRIYVKGSPEVISTLCDPKTVPADFQKVLLDYTMSGLRVIACATKSLENNISKEDDVSRESFEHDLEFLGFLIFENKMKEVTESIIAKLKEANIGTLMLTGDNPLTAVFVAKECGIVSHKQKVVLGTLKTSDDDAKTKEIEWKIIEGSRIEQQEDNLNYLDDITLKMLKPERQDGIEITPASNEPGPINTPKAEDVIKMISEDETLAVAMTGEVSKHLDLIFAHDLAFQKILLRKAKVYARMRPDDKAAIIDKLRNEGKIVGMCGDGANDCPALKVANIGVALSEAEASLAAPFMSKIIDISCIDIVLREGRTALVTSFQCFKFMSIYALIQTFNVAVLSYRGSTLSDLGFLYQDLYCALPIALTMGMVKPTEKLSTNRPTENLLSAQILTGMFGQCFIQCISQIITAAILAKQSWYIEPAVFIDAEIALTEDEDANPPDFEKSAVLLVASFQIIATVLAFSSGKPFRKPFYTNIPFTIWITINGASTLIMVLFKIPKVIDFMGMLDFEEDQGFRWLLFGIIIINSIVTISYEKVIVPSVFRLLKKIFKKKKKET